jgi:hypothetical protein
LHNIYMVTCPLAVMEMVWRVFKTIIDIRCIKTLDLGTFLNIIVHKILKYYFIVK